MSDLPKPESEPGGEWKMPEPTFRTSEGRTPGTASPAMDDEPTEPGFSGAASANANDPLGVNADVPEAAAAPVQPVVAAKRGGCRRAMTWLLAVILLSIAIVSGLLIYLIYFYRPADTGNF
jgi:hypothetical protein